VTSLDRYRNSSGQIWLNVASSTYVLKDFANLDNHVFLGVSRLPALFTSVFPKKYRDYIKLYQEANRTAALFKHDCRKPIDMPANVADHILCSHFLEHVFPDEASNILRDFWRVLKPRATVHIIVPDIAELAESYVRRRKAGEPDAADNFIRETLLSTETRGSLKYRLLEATGGFGLQHRWMYDLDSIRSRVAAAGFEILAENNTPSRAYREGDGSVHVVARKVAP